MSRFLLQNDEIGMAIDNFGRVYRYPAPIAKPLTFLGSLAMIPFLIFAGLLWLFYMAVFLVVCGLVIMGLGWLYFIKGVGVLAMANLFLAFQALRSRAWFPKSVRDIRAFRIEQWSDFTSVVKGV